MYHVSVGGMKMRGWRVFARVIWLTYKALRAAKAAPGCVHADIFRDGRRYFAMSVWTDEAAMKAYAHRGVHADMMRGHARMLVDFTNVSYQCDTIPTRTEAQSAWQMRPQKT